MEARIKMAALLMGAVLVAGCSKSDPEPEMVSTAPKNSPPEVKSGLADISQKVESQQYDAAVGSLVMVGGMPMSDEDRAAFNVELQKTIDALAQKASQGDPAARESQQMLGRMITGR